MGRLVERERELWPQAPGTGFPEQALWVMTQMAGEVT